MDHEDVERIYDISDELYSFVLKMREAAKATENEKAKDYFSTGAERLDQTYLKLRNALWYAGSAVNFKDVKNETS